MTPQSNISHAEVWDDSLLVKSWDEALAEYKQYHSMHARGERVEDVLKETGNSNGNGEQVQYEEGEVNDHVHDPHAKANPSEEMGDPAQSSTKAGSRVEKSDQGVSNQSSGGRKSNDPALPQHLVGQVHDESLKNLLMSWYYAGYYTGLYEGQKQGAANKDA